MRTCAVLLGLLLAGCGGSTPSSPTPTSPVSRSITVTGTITETLTGAPLGGFTREVPSLPTTIEVSAPGHVTRTVWITSASPTVDLIAENGFDLDFYRELVRGALDGKMDVVYTLTTAPSIYMQIAGLSASNITALEQTARFIVPALSDNRLQLIAWETGPEPGIESDGRIVVDVLREDAEPCGRARIGTSKGHIWLNTVPRCGTRGYTIDPGVFAHELGHALGFWHVSGTTHLMAVNIRTGVLVSPAERHHAAIAYARPRGNRDVDVDPSGGSATSFPAIILP